MPVSYQVQASVVDLRGDAPRATDQFWVDTNVWIWLTYPPITAAMERWRRQQTTPYVSYLNGCYAARSTICWCPLQFAELTHNIEKTEYEIALRSRAVASGTRPKEYRHNHPAERLRVTGLIQAAWATVAANGSVCLHPALSLDPPLATQAAADVAALTLDGYDLFFVQALRAAGVSNIITDDGDFCTVPGVILFTANTGVIAAARAQGKLLTR